jgi:hypothetical protein
MQRQYGDGSSLTLDPKAGARGDITDGRFATREGAAVPEKDWVRPSPRAPRALPDKPVKPVSALFYGVPVEVIAKVCDVTRATARGYKIGSRKPSRQVNRLMQLHNADRVLDPQYWPRGWRFHKNSIVDPDGNITTEAQLRGYAMLIQVFMHRARQDDALRQEVEPILRIMESSARRA